MAISKVACLLAAVKERNTAMSDGAIGKHGMQHGRELIAVVVVEEA